MPARSGRPGFYTERVRKARKGSVRPAESSAAPRVVVLAAGVGSRMRSSQPKVLHRVGGRTLLELVLDTAETVSPSRVIAVLGAGRDRVEPSLAGRSVHVVLQEPPLGTGDAARQALPALGGSAGPVLVLSGDVPFLRAETLRLLVERQRNESLDLVFLSFRPPDPADFGRVLRDRTGGVRRIVEAKNATAAQRRIAEVNAGVYCFEAAALGRALSALQPNAVTGEFYLTDAVEILASRGGRVEALEAADWREAWGINTRRDLAAAEEIARRQGLERAMDSGATLMDPSTTRVGPRVTFGRDAVIHPFVSLEGRSALEEGCEILPFTRIVDSVVGQGCVVGPHCEVEGAQIGTGARVGPFARLRPGTVLEEGVRVGNFVETKEAVLRRGTKALHLSYLGDTEIGPDANIGAGVITCNYDGEKKHRTVIGEGAFIGSDSQLVAPVTVGDGAYVGAGSTITRDVPGGSLALSRVKQENKEGWVARRKAKRSG